MLFIKPTGTAFRETWMKIEEFPYKKINFETFANFVSASIWTMMKCYTLIPWVGTVFREIWIKIEEFPYKKNNLEMLANLVSASI